MGNTISNTIISKWLHSLQELHSHLFLNFIALQKLSNYYYKSVSIGPNGAFMSIESHSNSTPSRWIGVDLRIPQLRKVLYQILTIILTVMM